MKYQRDERLCGEISSKFVALAYVFRLLEINNANANVHFFLTT